MTDVAIITRDPQGSTDDVWDPVSGTYTPAANDTVDLYQGPCLILPINVFPTEATEGAGTRLITDYEMHIPLDSQYELAPRDIVTVLASQRNAHMVGDEFWIREIESGGATVSQKARIYRRDTVVTL